MSKSTEASTRSREGASHDRPAFTRHGLFSDSVWTGLPGGFPFESVVSLAPVIAHWRRMSAKDPATYGATWQRLERRLADAPALTEPLHDVQVVDAHHDLIRDLIRPLFPSSDWTNAATALSGPFGGYMLYRTRNYERAMGPYLEARMDIINVHDHYLRTLYAYKAILGKFYGIQLNLDQPLIFVIPEEESGLSRYFKLNGSTQFATIELKGELPTLTQPDVDTLLQHVGDMARWQALLPPGLFRFVGLTVTTLTDVTHETAIAAITHLVLTGDVQATGATTGALEQETRTLFRDARLMMGVSGVKADGTLEDRPEHRLWNPLAILDGPPEGRPRWEGTVYERALQQEEGLMVRDVAAAEEIAPPLQTFLLERGIRSLFLQALRYEDRTIGLLELAFPTSRAVDTATMLKARRIAPIFALALYVADSTAQLKRSLSHLKATQAQLVQKEKMASLGQLTAGIAHEIKNPLNFVNNFAEVNAELTDELEQALDEGDHDEVRALLADLKQNARVIAQHGKRADSIVRAMMQHAAGGSGQRVLTDLDLLVAEHIDLAYHGKQSHVTDRTVAIRRDLAAGGAAVEIVPQEIGRVLLNLLGNAFDAVQAHATDVNGQYTPTVTVSTRQVDGGVEIRVSDNGPGIPPELQEKIFEPFFTTKPTGSGTGLGLSLSYDIVTQGHGGTLTVERTEGEGASFIVTLPVKRAARTPQASNIKKDLPE